MGNILGLITDHDRLWRIMTKSCVWATICVNLNKKNTVFTAQNSLMKAYDFNIKRFGSGIS